MLYLYLWKFRIYNVFPKFFPARIYTVALTPLLREINQLYTKAGAENREFFRISPPYTFHGRAAFKIGSVTI